MNACNQKQNLFAQSPPGSGTRLPTQSGENIVVTDSS
jgi:hypothetical protein